MSASRRIPAPPPGRLDAEGITETFARRMKYSLAKDSHTATDFDVYQALAFAVRDRLMERWFLTQDSYYRNDVKRVYYLSLEFLMGRALSNNMISLGALPEFMGQGLTDLVQVLPELEGPQLDAYFVYPEELRASKRIQVFRDFLLRKVAESNF